MLRQLWGDVGGLKEAEVACGISGRCGESNGRCELG